METEYQLLRWFAAIAGATGSLIIASGGSRQRTAIGFCFTLLSGAAWTLVGLLADETALFSEYLVLLVINGFGVWRWGRPLGPEDEGLAPIVRAARERLNRLWRGRAEGPGL